MYRHWMANQLSPQKIASLADLGIAPEELYGMDEKSLKGLTGLTDKDRERLLESRKKWNIEAEWNLLQEKGISFVSIEEAAYPPKLKNITAPPYALYYTGSLPDPDRMQIGMVGARSRSAYGQEVSRRLAFELGKKGIEIISGLAMGIDTDSHKGALESGEKTYAVLGCGVDVVYPRQNDWLYRKISAQGGVISEFAPGTPAISRNFPRRNRIISGLCDKLIVVEARLRSGSLITADYAMEQGRDVYAVPGRITDPLSQGTNRLIHQGAGVILGIEDFLQELTIATEPICTQLDFCKNLLEKDEMMVYSLVDFQPLGLGTLMRETSMELSQLLPVLENLKGKGFIRECAPNYFVKTL